MNTRWLMFPYSGTLKLHFKKLLGKLLIATSGNFTWSAPICSTTEEVEQILEKLQIFLA